MENKQDYVVGVGAGTATYFGTKKILNRLISPYDNIVDKTLTNYNNEEKALLKSAVSDAFEKSGLKSKKFDMHNVNENNTEELTELVCQKIKKIANNLISKFEQKMEKELSKNNNTEKEEFLKAYKEKCQKELEKSISKVRKKIKENIRVAADGENAFAMPITKDFFINVDKMGGAGFHEEGHLLNQIGSVSKILSYGRHITAAFVPIILAISLLNKKKDDGQKPEGFKEKTGAFIKNNAGKLTFFALVPKLAEEGLASIRGIKLAKKVPYLTPEIIKKMGKSYIVAWSTYLIGATITSFAVRFAVDICDRIKNNKKTT